VDETLEPCGVDLFDIPYNSKLREIIKNGFLLRQLLHQNHLPGATMAFRRDLLEYLIPFPHDIPGMCHDSWIGILGVARGKYEFLDRPLIKYRQHAGQSIGVGVAKSEGKMKEPNSSLSRIEEASIFTRLYVERCLAILDYFRRGANLVSQLPAIEKEALPIISELNRRLEHYTRRKNLPRSLIQRSRFILNETFLGNYHQFSNGLKSILKDLFYL